jgi:cathepsin D
VDLNIDFEIVFSDGRISSGKQYTDNVTIAGFTVCFYCLRTSSLLTNE